MKNNFSLSNIRQMQNQADRLKALIKSLKTNQLQISKKIGVQLDQDGFKNPWTSIKPARVSEKQRRPFTDEERRTVAIDEQRLYKRHAKLLARLAAAGKMPGGVNGLSFYSWKDTGISLHAARTGAIPTKDQAGHASLDMTSVYYTAPEVLQEYKLLENTLFL